ncbi:hypothetical protein A8V01_10275 [Novosphingobium guangzhouense]|uniref:Glycoside hydrolase family 42 N-terminal domain-containing protein n=2 Tax=Novosphingobium guangzhouense TaxID=1850347 RepID=A0A2K2FU13_9SPHN|nr:hypothetical protein A8V01_10275 [Novosphingobium guangzhouense]
MLCALTLSATALAEVPTSARPSGNLIFQTDKPWSPRVNVDAGTVMVYGIDESLRARIRSWREHGYRVAVMTGVSWGFYADYLRGDFDGREHWDETQEAQGGKLLLHTGREVPYMVPTQAYGRYLNQGIRRALEAGAEAIYLEEPEFWAKAGWSSAFKAAWRAHYGRSWEAPDSSPDAQYRASRLKYKLYRDALAQVFTFVREWGAAHGRMIPCYVATHSVLNYAQWKIVSPESSLLDVGADGYIAQVWTGTARTPTVYEGVKAERTFESAFLEYGALQNIARSSGKTIWYLNDPIEDNPNHSWIDYRRNWESTLTASLMQPDVANYEVLPWPDRIFGADALYPTAEHTPTSAGKSSKSLIPPAYFAELQTVFHALSELPGTTAQWQAAGTSGVGVLVSDSIMFQRAAPAPSDPALGNFYGLALPLLMRGIPVEPVQVETSHPRANHDPLDAYKLLVLTYEGQKPPSAAFHTQLANWVRRGGALVVVDDDAEPYHRASDWWNTGANDYATPRQHLFETLGITDAAAKHGVATGKGWVHFALRSPSALGRAMGGSDTVRALARSAAVAVGLPWRESPALVLRRGPYIIAAGIEVADHARPIVLSGRYLDLFDAEQPLIREVNVSAGSRRLLVDLDQLATHTIAAAGARITGVTSDARHLSFKQSGMRGNAGTTALISIVAKSAPKRVLCDGERLANTTFADGVLRIRTSSDERPRTIDIIW